MRRDITYKITENECWECTSHKIDTTGYFRIRINWKLVSLHRYMYEQEFGPIKEGNKLRHKCDNAKCINPEHLIEGTQADNIQDAIDRNRNAKGIKNGRAILNEQQVIEIFNSDDPHIKIANRYNIAKTTVSSIKTGVNWKHVTSGTK